MKSLKKATKLELNKTTVRNLTNIELKAVPGGLTFYDSGCRYCERQTNPNG